jgi:hypothetical protein
MKIDLQIYKKSIIDDLVAHEILDVEMANKVVNRIEEFTNTHLPCNNCNMIYMDRAFYKSKAHKARRNRLTVCRQCHPQIYGGGGKK